MVKMMFCSFVLGIIKNSFFNAKKRSNKDFVSLLRFTATFNFRGNSEQE